MIKTLPTGDPKTLVSTGWLDENLSDVKLLDASWYMPASERDGRAEFAGKHIPGAQFFDIDEISDTSSDLPHMLPSPAIFAEKVGALGIGNKDQVVIYDGAGLFSAARVWWMFRAMGHVRVAVLDGGLPKWEREGRDVTADIAPVTPATFEAPEAPTELAQIDMVFAAIAHEASAQVLDARPAGRFEGREPEPREGLRSGHMPESINVPFAEVLTETGEMKSRGELEALFRDRGVYTDVTLYTTCGSGVTAAILSLALARIGASDVALYDGSWAEWGARSDTPVVTG